MELNQRSQKRDRSQTLVSESVGNDTPRKKPNTIPMKVVTASLIVSLGFRIVPLHPKKEKKKKKI